METQRNVKRDIEDQKKILYVLGSLKGTDIGPVQIMIS